jgi:hypothetical protein
MSKKTLFLFLPIFLVFFVWGLQVGDNFPRTTNGGMFDLYDQEEEIKIHPNGQKTLLLVLISQLDIEKPDLLGVWQLTYFPSEPYTTVLPVYPTHPKEIGYIDDSIRSSFNIKMVDGVPFLDDVFLNHLDQSNIWSSGYVLIDLYGLAEAIILSDGGEYLSLDMKDGDPIGQISQYIADPNSSLTYQTLLLQNLCGHFTRIDSLADLNDLRALFPDHISGNIHPDVLLKDWREFIKAKNGSFCIFPSAEEAAQIKE